MIISITTDIVLDRLYARSALMKMTDREFPASALLTRDNETLLRGLVADAFMALTSELAPRTWLSEQFAGDHTLRFDVPQITQAHPGALSGHLVTAVEMMTLSLVAATQGRQPQASAYRSLAIEAWRAMVSAIRCDRRYSIIPWR